MRRALVAKKKGRAVIVVRWPSPETDRQYIGRIDSLQMTRDIKPAVYDSTGLIHHYVVLGRYLDIDVSVVKQSEVHKPRIPVSAAHALVAVQLGRGRAREFQGPLLEINLNGDSVLRRVSLRVYIKSDRACRKRLSA